MTKTNFLATIILALAPVIATAQSIARAVQPATSTVYIINPN